MEYIYQYTREVVPGGFNVNHPDRVDLNSKQIYLASEIQAALPGKRFYVRCNGSDVKIIFLNNDIAPQEKSILDSVFVAHKSNT